MQGLDRGLAVLHSIPNANVERLARTKDIAECFDRLLKGRSVIVPMGLIQVDVVGAQTAQRRVDRFADVLLRQAGIVGARVLQAREVDLRTNND